ncbi:MAG: hypothetical protein QM699_13785 [Amaricoccus sp.]|uniref:hypothetical protein n=1 Tax=Amaricoccus sp. TaxID=1872485 RepID=UPI0039E6C002
MGVSNPLETVVRILQLIDEVKSKMVDTQLAKVQWRPQSPESANSLAELAHEALVRCDDVTEAVIVVTVAAMTVATREAEQSK